MAFRLLCLFRLWLLVSLKTPLDRLHFVPLFLKLFCLCKFRLFFFFFFEICPAIAQGCFWWFLISHLGGGVSRPVSGIGTPILLLCLFEFKVLRGSRACLIRVQHFL